VTKLLKLVDFSWHCSKNKNWDLETHSKFWIRDIQVWSWAH